MSRNNIIVNRENKTTIMSRIFNAPRELVWRAHTDPALVSQWWGPRKYKTVVEKLEPKVGGEWKFINKAEGEEHVFYGEFREIKAPEKIVWTFIYEPYKESVIVETLTLEELPGGKTKLTTVSSYPSIEALDGMLQGGMEAGATETWDRLEELVKTT